MKKTSGKVKTKCDWCKEDYLVHRYRLSKTKYCSFSCHQSYKNSIRNYNDGSQVSGEKHYKWKGNDVSYRNLHRWVERELGKAYKCMKDFTHKSTRYHWANISKEYKRDLSDWIQLCPSCNCSDKIGRRVSA